MNRPAISGREHGNTANTESACGCEAATGASGEVEDAVEHLWQVRDIQFGLASGVLLLAGFVLLAVNLLVHRLALLAVVAALLRTSTCTTGSPSRWCMGPR